MSAGTQRKLFFFLHGMQVLGTYFYWQVVLDFSFEQQKSRFGGFFFTNTRFLA